MGVVDRGAGQVVTERSIERARSYGRAGSGTLGPVRDAQRRLGRAKASGAAASLSWAVSARPRPHLAQCRVSPPQPKDAGFHRRDGRLPPDATHPHARGLVDRPHAGPTLALNEDLVEALALAHDIGHPPFGHSGEDVLDECLHDEGGFNHNAQALRIVERLETRYPEFPGLNLTREVLDGQRQRANKNAPASQSSVNPLLEVQVVDAADSIAYDSHDADDALAIGLLKLDQLLEVPLWREPRLHRPHPDHPARRPAQPPGRDPGPLQARVVRRDERLSRQRRMARQGGRLRHPGPGGRVRAALDRLVLERRRSAARRDGEHAHRRRLSRLS